MAKTGKDRKVKEKEKKIRNTCKVKDASNNCDFCQRKAVDWCFSCGWKYCKDHYSELKNLCKLCDEEK